MGKLRGLGAAAVFLAGCALGGASSRFVVPQASAQQAATLTKWDYLCFEESDAEDVQRKAKAAGAEGWELAGAIGSSPGGSRETWCFKRSKT